MGEELQRNATKKRQTAKTVLMAKATKRRENPPPNPKTPFFTTHSNCKRTTHREIYYELKRKARALRNAEKKKVYLLHEFFYFSTIFYK